MYTAYCEATVIIPLTQNTCLYAYHKYITKFYIIYNFVLCQFLNDDDDDDDDDEEMEEDDDEEEEELK